MPKTIDESVLSKRMMLDMSAPQGSPTGLPVRDIPHEEYPRVIYKHPVEPFKTIEHRNAKQEVVREEIVQAEHLTRVVSDKKELESAMKDGWKKEPYLPQPLPNPNAGLYGAN
jgi:hypothetical protein